MQKKKKKEERNEKKTSPPHVIKNYITITSIIIRKQNRTLNKQHYRRTEVGLRECPAVMVPRSQGLDLCTVGLLSSVSMFQTRHRHTTALFPNSPRHTVHCRCVYTGCRRTDDTK